MTEQTVPPVLAHPIVQAYLRDLDAALIGTPESERALVREEITAHIVAAAGASSDEATIRAVLDNLGDPATVADSSTLDGLTSTLKGAFLESQWGGVLTVLALAFGGILIPLVGWIAGVAMLWVSSGWTRGEKILGTLVLPGGFAGLLLTGLLPVWSLAGFETCEASSDSTAVACDTVNPLLPTALDGAVAILFLLLVAAQTAVSIILLMRFRAARLSGA